MSKVKNILLPLLPTLWSVDIYYSKDYKAVDRMLCEKYNEDYAKEENRSQEYSRTTICYNGTQSHIIMVILEEDPGAIAHEATHVSWYLDRKCGFNLSYDNQEIQAYYIDYVFRETWKLIKGSK